jgi:hypothetical protein
MHYAAKSTRKTWKCERRVWAIRKNRMQFTAHAFVRAPPFIAGSRRQIDPVWRERGNFCPGRAYELSLEAAHLSGS